MVEAFVRQLAAAKAPPDCVNIYAPTLAGGNGRCHNLCRYLEQMQAQQPRLLLLGEAPGYRGCRISGIPFVSRQLLRQGAPGWNLLGQHNGYQIPTDFPGIERENSATLVWQALAEWPRLPLLWNACPWHPHRHGQPASNRPPTLQERQSGEPYLRHLLALFAIEAVVAVGAQAARALTDWGIPHQQVRHPAHGGKAAFLAGMAQIRLRSCG